MKKHLLYVLSVFVLLSACKDMDSEYKDFIVPNGLTYPQRADSLKIYSGFNKLRLQWLKPKFPGVKYSMVYWNNYVDSLKVDFPDIGDTISVDITNLDETSYSFYIKNFDDQGNASIPVEGTGTPYGENFLIGASDRVYTSALRDDQGKGTITWAVKTPNLVYTEVRYMSSSDVLKTVRISPNETELKIEDIKSGVKFDYRSVFLPPKGIDSIARDWQTSDKPLLYKYPRQTWTVEAKGGNHNWGDGGGGQPYLILDGNTATGWHSNVASALPQVVVVDMKQSLVIDHIAITPPAPANWRYINHVDVYLTDVPITADVPQDNWGSPVVSATYANEDSFKINFPEPKKGRYLAIVFKDSKSNTYISFMELEVYGY